MSNAFDYQKNRDDSNNKVDWYTESFSPTGNEVVVKSTAIKTTLKSDVTGSYEAVDVNSRLVDDSFKLKRVR